jgi:hypothetical protein
MYQKCPTFRNSDFCSSNQAKEGSGLAVKEISVAHGDSDKSFSGTSYHNYSEILTDLR